MPDVTRASNLLWLLAALGALALGGWLAGPVALLAVACLSWAAALVVAGHSHRARDLDRLHSWG